MKILILAEYYNPHIMGGGEISLKYFVDGLIAKGHSVYVLTPNCGSNEKIITTTGNLTIHKYKSFKYRTYKSKSKDTSSEIYNKSKAAFYLILNQVIKIFTWEMAKEARSVIWKYKFDLVHSNNIESMLALSKLNIDVPTIAHVRDLATVSLNYRTHNMKYNNETSIDIIKQYFNTNGLMARLIIWDIVNRRRRALNVANYIIAINEYVKGEIEIEGPENDNVKVVYNPIESNVSSLTKAQAKKQLGLKEKFNVLFVGSLTQIKGAHFIAPIAALALDVNFIVIGDGPFREQIETSGLTNIDYRGKVKDVKDYYRACDILLLPQTVHYGIGRVAIEAMINGLPIVSTNIEGIDKFIIDKKTGRLVYHWVPKQFARTIKELLNSKTERNNMSKECIKLVKGKFDVKNIVDKLEKVYEGIKDAKFMYNGHVFSK